MKRRARPPKYDTTIPEGWTVHDGSGEPASLPKDACPVVMQRNGARLGENLPAAPTIGFGALPHERSWGWEWGRLWTWDAAEPASHDIVAYLDDGTRREVPKPPAVDEFIAIPRMALTGGPVVPRQSSASDQARSPATLAAQSPQAARKPNT